MVSVVVYDSFFGNTKEVAVEVAKALKAKLMHVKEFQNLKGLNLIVIASPTRAFRPTEDIQKFIKKLKPLNGVRVAAFDTRIHEGDTDSKFLKFMIKLFGYADKRMVKALKKKGGTLVAPPIGFYVEGTKGPLKEGEIERAKAWALAIV